MNGQDNHINIILADNQQVARMGMRMLVEDVANISIVKETGNGQEALRLVRELKPDVLVIEMKLPDMTGIQIAVAVSESKLDVPVLAYSSYVERSYIEHTLSNGIAGYAMKQDPPEEVIKAIREVAAGARRWFTPRVAQKVVELRQDGQADGSDHDLSPREWDVLQLMSDGLTTRAIAEELFIAPNTIRSHEASIRRKLGADSRYEAVIWLWKKGLKKPEGH